MDEKEFLDKYTKFLGEKYWRLSSEFKYDLVIAEFLQEHHKYYNGVYFYPKSKTQEQVIEEQLRIKLTDFCEFLMPGMLDDYFIESRIEEYIKQKGYK